MGLLDIIDRITTWLGYLGNSSSILVYVSSTGILFSISFNDILRVLNIFRVSDTYFYNQYNWVINRNCFVLGLSSLAIETDIALVVLIALYI